MSVHVARLLLRSQAFHWAELSWAERGACRGVCAYKADISCLVVRSSVNPRARYLMVGWTWTDIDGCVWTICIIHMFNMQNAAGTQATACFQGYLYACLCTHAHTYTHICTCVCVSYMKCLQIVCGFFETCNELQMPFTNKPQCQQRLRQRSSKRQRKKERGRERWH